MRHIIKLSICSLLLALAVAFATFFIHAAPTCTVTIPVSVTLIDGNSNYSQLKPGDTVCIAGGLRKAMTIKNIRGQQGKPVTIINNGGVVRIDAEQARSGIEIETSSDIRLTGTGVIAQCGSAVAPVSQQCGIDVFNATKALSAESLDGTVNNIEIDHVTVHDSNPNGAFPTGISFKPRNLKHITGIRVHHTYVHDTMFEGMYIGNDPNKPPSDNGTMSHVDIHHNLVERTGFDGINVKQATNIEVHHNIVRTTGLMNGKVDHVSEGGIQLASSMGEVFNNLVIDSDDTGLNVGRELPSSNTRFYNNIIVNSTNEGIKTQEINAAIYNNTIINNGAAGIDATGANAKVYDNIVVGTITGRNSGNNLIGSLQSMGFANTLLHDYHLTSGSPAINKGGIAGSSFDFDDKPRPQDSKSDIGAYEFGNTQISPTITPTLPPISDCPKKSRGDANCDGFVDIVDFEIFRKEYTGPLSTKDSDFDMNNIVDIVDFEIWRRGMFIAK
ncbi:MAG: hypothetical protein RI947_1188 [Candidatus Parcubacteria bacterium]